MNSSRFMRFAALALVVLFAIAGSAAVQASGSDDVAEEDACRSPENGQFSCLSAGQVADDVRAVPVRSDPELTGVSFTFPQGAVQSQYLRPEIEAVTAEYSDGSSRKVTEYTVTPEVYRHPGEVQVTVSYTENGITQEVIEIATVEPAHPQSMVMKTDKMKLVYEIGDRFTTAGAKAVVTYSNGHVRTVSGPFDYDAVEDPCEFAGDHTVSIYYEENGQSVRSSVPIKVNGVLDSIFADSTNAKKVYSVGETYDAEGLMMFARCTGYRGVDKMVIDIPLSQCIWDAAVLTETGNREITFSYTSGDITKSCTVQITVLESVQEQQPPSGGEGDGDLIITAAAGVLAIMAGAALLLKRRA